MGAAGRDFHDFLTFFRAHPDHRVVAFTAAQIPFIERRSFPHELAGPGYDDDIPIFPEEQLGELITHLRVDLVFLSYSDLSHLDVMHRASFAQSHGAGFVLLGPKQTQLRASVPVVAITASRTGAGKSPLSQAIARSLHGDGRSVAVLRHPMPYGDLRKQAVEHFVTHADLDRFACTLEEREEYEPYLEDGIGVWAGVDYREIVRRAEAEADVIVWDGGNNDVPFIDPDMWITVVDPLRAGDELAYYPGETNLRSADVIVISKAGSATREQLATVRANAAAYNPDATVIESDLTIDIDDPGVLVGRRALVIEDGPTVTHGGMRSGAGLRAACRYDALIVDPRPFASGTIADAYQNYPHLGPVVPALGYSADQKRDLAETIGASNAEVIVDASPARLDRSITGDRPVVRVRYRFEQTKGPPLLAMVAAATLSPRT
jgi:predicted GTPase